MNEDFIKSIYKTIVEENKELYKDLFNTFIASLNIFNSI